MSSEKCNVQSERFQRMSVYTLHADLNTVIIKSYKVVCFNLNVSKKAAFLYLKKKITFNASKSVT